MSFTIFQLGSSFLRGGVLTITIFWIFHHFCCNQTFITNHLLAHLDWAGKPVKPAKFIQMAENQVVGEKSDPFLPKFSMIKCIDLLSNIFILLYM